MQHQHYHPASVHYAMNKILKRYKLGTASQIAQIFQPVTFLSLRHSANEHMLSSLLRPSRPGSCNFQCTRWKFLDENRKIEMLRKTTDYMYELHNTFILLVMHRCMWCMLVTLHNTLPDNSWLVHVRLVNLILINALLQLRQHNVMMQYEALVLCMEIMENVMQTQFSCSLFTLLLCNYAIVPMKWYGRVKAFT